MDLARQMLAKLVLELLEKLVTPDMLKKGHVLLVGYLVGLAKQTDNEIDDKVVAIIAKALDVEVPAA